MSGLPARGLEIGIALGEGLATAVARLGGSTRRVTVPFASGKGTPGAAELAATLDRIARGLAGQVGGDVDGARVSFALLPPLADTRLIRLPPLRRAEAESVIRRDAARYFAGAAAARIVAAMPGGIEDRTENGSAFLAAAAPAGLVETLHTATRNAGWRLVSVAAAHGAWLAGIGGTRGARTVLAADGDVVHVIRVSGGRCVALRRAPADLARAILEAVGDRPGDAVLFAEPGARESLKAVLVTAGWRVDDGRLATAAEAAAANARRAALQFVPPAMAAQRRESGRRTLIRAVAAAALLVGGAAAVELWGINRELDAVAAERAAIRVDVAPLLAARDSIDRIRAESDAIRGLASSSPRWTRALFDLALLLPPDAHVTSLHTTGDTLVVEATAARAGEALQRLRRAGSLDDIRLLGTVERDLEGGATASERFRFTARLKAPADRIASGIASPGPAGGAERGSAGGRQ